MHEAHTGRFPHSRLEAFRAAMALMDGTVRLTTRLPRGFAELRDQARRSALATVRHIAEGASRVSHADKRSRFTVARGEVAELDATLESALVLDLVNRAEATHLRALADRTGALLSGLIERESRLIARAAKAPRQRYERQSAGSPPSGTL